MAKKAPKAPRSTADLAWRSILENAPVDDDDWCVKVVFIQPAANEIEKTYVNKFESKLPDEARFVIKGITKTETMFMINQLGKPKPDNATDVRVFEEAANLLKEGRKTLPSDLSALLIKHQLMALKSKDMATKLYKKALQEGLKAESAIMLQEEEVRKIATMADFTQGTPASAKPTKKSAKKSSREVQEQASGDKKCNTVLRVRGEEWRDKVFIDDFPEDGPDLYVAITGFTEPELLVYLVKYKIPLTAVVQVKIDPGKVPPTASRKTTENKGEKTSVFYDFWEQLQSLRIDPATADILTDVAFIAYSPLSPSSSKVVDQAETIYNDVSHLLYDIHELERQQKNYIDNMSIINVRLDRPNDDLFASYIEKVSILPDECCTLFFQLNCLVETLPSYETSTNTIQPTTTGDSTKYTHSSYGSTYSTERMDQQVQCDDAIAEKVVGDVFDALCHSADHKIVNLDEEYKEIVKPIVVKYMNYAHEIVSHLHIPVDMTRITIDVLARTPLGRIWLKFPERPEELAAKCDYHINALLEAFQHDNMDFTNLLRILFFLFSRKLYLKKDDDVKSSLQITLSDAGRKYLKRTLLAKPLSVLSYREIKGSVSNMSLETNSTMEEELPKKESVHANDTEIFSCPTLTTLVTGTEEETGKADKTDMNCYTYIERFSQPCMLQALHKSSQAFNSVATEYVPEMDKIIVHFYDAFDSNDLFTREWKSDLSTPVCLQDFLDFTYDEEYSWIQEEERRYDALNQPDNVLGNKVSLHGPSHTCLENAGQEDELLISGSLKHTEHLARIAETEATAAASKSTDKRAKRSNMSLVSSSRTKTSKTKDKKSPLKGTNKASETNHPTATSEHEIKNTRIHRKPFLGYDLTDRKICIYGRDTTFFSKDGTKIETNYIMYSPMNQEYITLHMYINGSDTCLHKAIGNYTNSIPKLGVRVTAKSKIILSFEEHIEAPVIDFAPIPSMSTIKDVKKSNKKQKSQTGSVKQLPTKIVKSQLELGDNKEGEISKPTTYNFTASWPNGLIVQSVRASKSAFPSHVRQHYITRCSESESLKKEKYRCVSRHGQVVIYKTDGSIEVLCHDSTYFNCGEVVEVPATPPGEASPPMTGNAKPDSRSDTRKKRASGKSSPQPAEKPIQREPKPMVIDVIRYSSIDAGGRQKVHDNGDVFAEGVLLRRTATDYRLGEVYTRRADGTNTLLTKDGTMTVTFPDKTRIVSYFVEEEQPVFPEWSPEELQQFSVEQSNSVDDTRITKSNKSIASKDISFNNDSVSSPSMGEEHSIYKDDSYILYSIVYEVEHPNFATVCVNHSTKTMAVSMQDNIEVTIDEKGVYNVQLDKRSTMQLNDDVIYFDYQACQDCQAVTYSEVNLKFMKDRSVPDSIDWVTMKDSYGKIVSVNHVGVFKIPDERISLSDEDKSDRGDSNSSQDVGNYSIGSMHKRCRVTNPENRHQFFLLNRDMTGEHLEHRDSVIKYKTKCRWQPWCSVNEYDLFCGCQKLESIITPVTHNASQKWIMESKYSAKPTNLTLKDLKAAGDNFYSWMRPYPQPPVEPTLPPLIVQPDVPDVLILRNLVPLHTEDNKFEILDEAVAAILRFRLKMEAECEEFTSDPMRDPRTDEEKEWCKILNRAALRYIKKYKKKLERHYEEKSKTEDLKTTRIVELPSYDYEICEQIERSGEYLSSTTIDTESSTDTEAREREMLEERLKPSPELQRFLQKHEEMKKKAEYYRKVLREGLVPPYFQNILGGALWAEKQTATEQARDESQGTRTDITSGGQ